MDNSDIEEFKRRVKAAKRMGLGSWRKAYGKDVSTTLEALEEAQRKNEEIAGANLDLSGEMQQLRDELGEALGERNRYKAWAEGLQRRIDEEVKAGRIL